MRERERRDKSSGEARTEVGIPYVLEALAPITITTFCTRLGVITLLITARGGPLTAHDSDLFPAHPVERRATDVERPDIVGRLQTVPAAEYLDLVLVRHRRMRASRRKNLSCRESRPQPSMSKTNTLL